MGLWGQQEAGGAAAVGTASAPSPVQMLPVQHQAGSAGLPGPWGFPPFLPSSPPCSHSPVLPGAGRRVCLPENQCPSRHFRLGT